jgi:hypothetical protein
VHAFITALAHKSFVCADPLPVLQYWAEQGALADTELLRWLLNWAGSVSNLSVAEWALQQGAMWPDVLRCGRTVWLDEAVDWARDEGCTAPDEVSTPYTYTPMHSESLSSICTL